MAHNEHKRHQHRYLPGEVTRQFKTAMREKRNVAKAFEIMWGWTNAADEDRQNRRAKSYRDALKWRNNSRQRQRDKELTEEGLNQD